MKYTSASICFILAFLFFCSLHGYETLWGKTELIYHDPAKAFQGYTLFGVMGHSYLLDMEGNVVHTWNIGTNPRLLDNGNLLDSVTGDPSHGAGFKEVDWDGNTVWEYTENRNNYVPHHDWVRIYNKALQQYTTIYIANKSFTKAEATAAGATNAATEGGQMDALVEVDMDGNIVWEWNFFDHLIQDADATKSNYAGAGKTVADYPNKLDINLPGRQLKNDWLHCNSIDYNEELGQVVTNSVQGEFYVIDHDGTFVKGDAKASIALAAGPDGDFLYRFGDPARYEQGDHPSILEDWTSSTAGHKQIGGAHDIHWIAKGLPGEGHFLIFNNGQYLFERTPQSYIYEINGFLNGSGNDTVDYVNPPEAGYNVVVPESRDTHKVNRNVSKQIVWTFTTKDNHNFFNWIGGGAQRLPNGNTLICSMVEGHVFEVTAEGLLVWEYINPVTNLKDENNGIEEILADNWPQTNGIFRAYRYAPDHPAFKGKDMTSQGTITGKGGTENDSDTVTADNDTAVVNDSAVNDETGVTPDDSNGKTEESCDIDCACSTSKSSGCSLTVI